MIDSTAVRVHAHGAGRSGSISACAVDRSDGRLTLLNTVRSGGVGPTYVSLHPAGKHVLVANYAGGSMNARES